jgi:hypothetical protein
MCTVSIVPTNRGFRLVVNRDERRSRPAAVPPRIHAAGRLRATFPIDPPSGGTWIAANEAGLVLALLNGGSGGASQVAFSRGRIIPSLVRCARVDAAAEAAGALQPRDFEPFRLLIAVRHSVAVLTSDGQRLSRTFMNLDQPLVWTSSSLGDALVERPRGALFDAAVRDTPAPQWPRRQMRFHRHRWPKHPELSVVMSRPDARTVSRTIVECADGALSMRYQPLGDSCIVVERRLDRVA